MLFDFDFCSLTQHSKKQCYKSVSLKIKWVSMNELVSRRFRSKEF